MISTMPAGQLWLNLIPFPCLQYCPFSPVLGGHSPNLHQSESHGTIDTRASVLNQTANRILLPHPILPTIFLTNGRCLLRL